MAAGTDAELQALLDPAANGRGIRIVRRTNSSNSDYACYVFQGNVTGVGKQVALDLLIADDDATHDTAVRAAFGVA